LEYIFLHRRIIEGLGDLKSPILLIAIMISKEKIQYLVDQVLSGDMFIVDIAVKTGNSIEVLVDSDKGISIEECVQISRHIEKNLDRDVEDFSLEVSSPGLSQPFRNLRQYQKNIGKKVELVARSGEKEEGILKSVNSMGIELDVTAKEKINGAKIPVTKSKAYSFEQIKTVKLVISFK
jgi:ribosome maturation factor RimP